jgi:hypothetical protein
MAYSNTILARENPGHLANEQGLRQPYCRSGLFRMKMSPTAPLQDGFHRTRAMCQDPIAERVRNFFAKQKIH